MRKYIPKLIPVFLLIILLITACNQVGPENPKPEEDQSQVEEGDPEKEVGLKPEDYFPLTQGSTWRYLGEGNEYATFTREVVFAEGNRAQIKEDNGGTVSASVFETTDEAVTRIFFQGESYENENYLNDESNDNLVILKAPLQVGTKWDTGDSTREILDLNASLNTPAGDFEKVLKIKITFPDSTIYEYYKDGVGMVKREYISNEDYRVTSSLEKYEIKKP
ncbi:MAG: hypothetical protein ACOX4H_09845 [Bacillota bacterium]|nr:hypothetical protein [Clostridia bacterium]